MNSDGLRLTDSIQTSNTLFEEVRVQGQVKQNQVMGKLEITTFTANL